MDTIGSMLSEKYQKLMEIGSFLELDLRAGSHLYSGDSVCCLNSARAGIWHCCRIYGVNKVYLPYYECYTVADFLRAKGVEVIYYTINRDFSPTPFVQESGSAVVIVNYFGLRDRDSIAELAKNYNNVIIDNAQALFSQPIDATLSVYSPRKFIGVPDGSYVVGKGANQFLDEYKKDYSSDTASFLFKRVEYGCSASYADRMKNEERIDNADIMKMSDLTFSILGNAPYEHIIKKRLENYEYAASKFAKINRLNLPSHLSDGCVPFVYPLVIEDESMVEKLSARKIYTGRWWKYLLDLTPSSSFEHYLSSYMIPVPIDQRYGRKEIDYICETIQELLAKK